MYLLNIFDGMDTRSAVLWTITIGLNCNTTKVYNWDRLK